MPDDHNLEEPCWLCALPPHGFDFECPECVRRWEELACRELRARLFAQLEEPQFLTG